MTIVSQTETIGGRLARIANRLPLQVALVEGDSRTNYRDLDATATGIAHEVLAVAGDRPGSVCLFFERKRPAIEAMFGAGRAGRAYVALDAGDPGERLRFIVADSEPVALLTEPALLDRARTIAPAGCAVVDATRVVDGHDGRALPIVPPDVPVYLCYTSGSTGRPKGVIQTHRNLLFFADAYSKALAIGASDRLSLLYTLSFNAANMDIYGGLLNGATLCACDMRRAGFAGLADWLDRERVTVLHCVPTVFRELAKRLAPGRMLPHLRAIDLGGEAVYAADVELFKAHAPQNCVFINQLASTEVGLIAQHVVSHRSPSPAGLIVPAGRCPPGVRVLVRREDGTLAGIHEAGEIVVSSAHVSPGYWRRPELDAATFADDPDQPGVRQYASGDVGHVDDAGNLHFLGRRGGRVKIRGHSVDVAEIEAALSACPGVMKNAVLTANDDVQAPVERLVAYVVVRESRERDPALMRRRLTARLPAYMLPTAFVFLDALPLTASGKIDRAALASMSPASTDATRDIEPAQDDVERTVAAIFEQLLNVAPIGRQDDFFLLGGDSLLGMELQNRLSEAFGLHVANFHEDATVVRIAQGIRRERGGESSKRRARPVLLPLWTQGNAPPLFLIHGRHGQAFVSPHFMQLLGNDQPVWAFQARGLDGLQAPYASIEAMVADYVAEMRKQQPRGPYFIGALCAGAYVAAAMARTVTAQGQSVLPLLLLDPPERLLDGYSQMSEEAFIGKMKARRAQGRTAGPVDDPTYMKSVLRVAMAFEEAIAAHRPLPYDGPAYMLSSRQRMQGADSAGLRKVFTGRIKRFEVGSTHAQALDPRNPVFASYLLRCVGLIREAAASVKPAPASGWAAERQHRS